MNTHKKFLEHSVGLGEDLGSLKAGKIADLIILNKNPLENIYNTKEIRFVMKDGILYNGNTLDEIWPQAKKLPNFNFKKETKK